MEDVIDVLLTGTYDVDEELFLLWCSGSSVDQSVKSTMDTTMRALSALRTAPAQQQQMPQSQSQSQPQSQAQTEAVSLQVQSEGQAPGGAASAEQADGGNHDPVEQLRRQASSDTIGSITEETMLSKLLQSEITDQWRVFEMVEHFLQTPLLFANSFFSFHMSPTLHLQHCLRMIHMYYSFDGSVAKELVGRKITSKGRRDIDDVADAANVPLRSCKRQFENARRVFASLEETTQFQCNVFQYLSQQYLLGPPQALRYTVLLFLLYSRFQVYNKRRLQRLDYDDLEYCAAVIMACMVNDGQAYIESGIDESREPLQCVSEVNGFDLDKRLIASIRDIRAALQDRDMLELFVSLVKDPLGNALSDTLQQRLRAVLKNLLSIGANLSYVKEFRDLFEDMVIKIGEPLLEVGLRASDLPAIFEAIATQNPVHAVPANSVAATSFRGRTQDIGVDWQRFVVAVQLCVQRFFDKIV